MLRCARELDESGEKVAKERAEHRKDSFGHAIVDAIAGRLRPRAAFVATAAAGADAPKADEDSFGDLITAAVKQTLRSRQPRFGPVASTDEDESFAEEIKKAVEQKRGGLPTQRQHREYVERERERYRPLQQREHGKSE